jgi:hypothetical protein
VLANVFIFISVDIGDQQGVLFRVRRIFWYYSRGAL